MCARHLSFASLFLVASCLCASLLGDEGQKELQGDWQVTGLVIDGQVVWEDTKPANPMDGFKLVVKDNRLSYSMIVNGKSHQIDFDVRVDDAQEPRAIDAKSLGGAW